MNDTYGHPCGDRVLQQVADRMKQSMRNGDLATRIGGDEFAIILVETGVEGALTVAEKLRTELRQMTFSGDDGKDFHITTSIGVVTYPSDAHSISDLMAGWTWASTGPRSWARTASAPSNRWATGSRPAA